MKFQSERCLDVSFGSVEDGQCYPISENFQEPLGVAYNEVQIHIVCPQTLQTALNAFLNSMMPRIIQLRCQPYLVPWNTGVFDPLPHFMLVPIGKRGIDVSIAFLKGNLDGVANLIGLALPGAKANGGDLVASVEGKGFAILTQRLAGVLGSGKGWDCGDGVGAYEVIFEAVLVIFEIGDDADGVERIYK